MFRIGICDDSLDARFALRCALERILEQKNMAAAFLEFSTGERMLHWMGNHLGELDLVFLDMEMGALNGIETARKLRDTDDGVLLVFVTAYADRVFDGYSVGALGYLMKPPKPEQLEDILLRASAALQKNDENAFVCRCGDVAYRIPVQSILYFVSDRRRITCVTKNRSCTFYGKLDAVEQALGPGFVRIHQRYLVRAAAVDRFSGSEVFLGEAALPVSRSCQKSAMLSLARSSLEDLP